jgi:hypothetical protein
MLLDAFALVGRRSSRKPGVGQGGLEVSPVVVLVGDHGLAESGLHPVGVVAEDLQQGLTFVGLGADQRERYRWAVQGGDQGLATGER